MQLPSSALFPPETKEATIMRTLGKIAATLGVIGAIAVGSAAPAAAWYGYYQHRHYGYYHHPYYDRHYGYYHHRYYAYHPYYHHRYYHRHYWY